MAVSDGLPEDHPRVRDLTALCEAILQMAPTFEDLITTLLRKSSITCIIRDTIFTTVHHVAQKFDIPVAAFITSSAVSMQCTYHLNTFISTGILPIPPPPREASSTPSLHPLTLTLALPQSDAEAAVRSAPLTCLPGGSPTMRVDDIPTFLLTHELENFFVRFFLEHQNPVLPESECVLYNTFMELESGVLMNSGSVNENIFAVGPLVLDYVDGVDEVITSLAGVGSALWEEDPVSISWLDDQKASSVLFVSFGSIVTVSMKQMREFAAGLEMSNVAFLWVVSC